MDNGEVKFLNSDGLTNIIFDPEFDDWIIIDYPHGFGIVTSKFDGDGDMIDIYKGVDLS